MPGVAQPGIVGTRQDLSDLIFTFDAEETPYLSMVAKGSPPRQEIHQWQADIPSTASKTGKKDNSPTTVTTSQTKDRAILETNSHWVESAVSVGKKAATINDVAGIGRGNGRLLAVEIAKATRAVKTAMDQILCDDEDQRDEGAGGLGSETRGLGNWIQVAAQTNRPVPEKYRTPADQVYAGTLAALTEADLQDILASQYTNAGKAERFIGLCGINLKKHVSNFSIYTPDKASHAQIRQFNADIKSRVLAAVISIIEADGGTIELHLSRNLGIARNSSEQTTASKNRGYILQMRSAEVKFAQKPEYETLPKDGGGDRGRVDGIFAHCLTPKMNAKIAAT